MATLRFDDLITACRPGGPSVLTSVTQLEPAAGPFASVAPAKFVEGSGQNTRATFAFEVRYDGAEAVQAVVIDSKQSQLNRCEAAVQQAIDDAHPLYGRLPRIEVRYETDGQARVFTDLQLPHRAFDGHIRAGTVDGVSVTQHPRYRAARDSSNANARALFDLSPGSLVFGSWDSTRKSNQVRFRSCLVGEIVGVLADQREFARDRRPDPATFRKGGARVDPVAMSVQLPPNEVKRVFEAQKSDISPKLYEKGIKTKAGDAVQSLSNLGLGGIPPNLNALGGVACSRITRSHVLSFAALRQLRFGAGPEGDAAIRALLAAYALAALTRSDNELLLRANCDLVEKDSPAVTLDQRNRPDKRQVDPLSVDAADALLEQALDSAADLAAVDWSGQQFVVTGDPAIIRAATDDSNDG